MKNILIISTTGMGDCLWGTPGIRAVKKTFPDVKVNLLASSIWKPLFEGNPYLNEILEYRSEWYRQPILGVQLLKIKFDFVFIFHANKNLKRMLPWFRSSPIWCHQPHLWVPEANRVKIEGSIHGIQRRLVMLEKFDVKSDGGQMEIFFDPLTLKKSEQVLQSDGFNSREYVYLNLGAAVESRRWMVDRFVELAKRILQATSWSVILGGGPGENKRALNILNHLNSPRIMEVCSQPIRVNASIISKSKLMVTSDTGPMHIGFATKTPVVALFGTISPVGSGPYNIPENLCRTITVEPKRDAVTELDSNGFNFKGITVNMVWRQVEKMIVENCSSL
jgi:ADP-heptose:LPS heptosyltransferase